MISRPKASLVMAALTMSCLVSATAQDRDERPRHNPFHRPVLTQVSKVATVEQRSQAAPALVLRGTLRSSKVPLVVVGDQIIGLGEEISGYRLVSVHEGSAIFTKDGRTLSLQVAGDEGGEGDE